MGLRHRRGQAALEFLSTYGWAVLVILVMIGAISYFGVLNPSKILPSRCVVASEFSCSDYILNDKTADSASASMVLKQSVGKTIYVQGMNCTYGAESVDATFRLLGTKDDLPAGSAWSPRDEMEFICPLTSLEGTRNTKLKMLFEITYLQSVGGFTHTAAGEIYSEVQ